MNYSVAAPRNWFGLTEEERTSRTKLSDDVCIIDDCEYYIHGCLEIPVLDNSENLIFGVWVSVSKESLLYFMDQWDARIVEDDPPRFGWLSTWVKGYPEPHEIQCYIFLRSNNLRPSIVLQPTEYPLSVEQQHGITLDRVKQIFADSGH
jgi:hypothetical protein